ncbi:MAG: hypothetical protein N3B11_00310 [Coriobacteriia bacterium]|nr:hypothetical protein [Coriobacteriia bacterium]
MADRNGIRARGVRPVAVIRAGAVIIVLGALVVGVGVLQSRCSGTATLREPDPRATRPVLAGVLPGGAETLANPVGLAWDGSRLYVCESDAGRIAVFDAAGRRTGTIRVPVASGAATAYPAAICTSENRTIAVVDAAAQRVLVINADTMGEARVVREIGGSAGVGQPTAVASVGGRLYVADASDGTIKVFDDGDRPVSVLAQDLNPKLTFVTSMSASDGSLYVVDSNAGRVIEMDVDTGTFRAALETRFTLPRGVAVLTGGRIAVADAFGGRVAVFSGTRQTGALDAGSVPGAPFRSIRALAWDGQRGRLFVADAGSGRVAAIDVPRVWGIR